MLVNFYLGTLRANSSHIWILHLLNSLLIRSLALTAAWNKNHLPFDLLAYKSLMLFVSCFTNTLYTLPQYVCVVFCNSSSRGCSREWTRSSPNEYCNKVKKRRFKVKIEECHYSELLKSFIKMPLNMVFAFYRFIKCFQEFRASEHSLWKTPLNYRNIL